VKVSGDDVAKGGSESRIRFGERKTNERNVHLLHVSKRDGLRVWHLHKSKLQMKLSSDDGSRKKKISNLQVGDDLGEKRTRVRLCGSASLENEVSE
jgi:hypothetical protein